DAGADLRVEHVENARDILGGQRRRGGSLRPASDRLWRDRDHRSALRSADVQRRVALRIATKADVPDWARRDPEPTCETATIERKFEPSHPVLCAVLLLRLPARLGVQLHATAI